MTPGMTTRRFFIGGLAAVFEVVATAEDGFSKKLAMIVEGARFSAADSRMSAPSSFRVACARLPEKRLKFSVCAISCWGRRSAPLEAEA